MSEPTEAQIEAFKAAWHEADEQGRDGDRVRAGLAAAMSVEPEPALRPHWISDAKIGAGVYLGFERGAWPIQAFSAALTHHILWVAKDPNNRVVIGPVHIPIDAPSCTVTVIPERTELREMR